MKITKISCEQFAGTRDREISLTDGINLIYGKNESGKSTLVNILSRTLFQNSRIVGKAGREYMKSYLPSARKGSIITADFIDGKVTFETENGEYTVSKIWREDRNMNSECKLSMPDGLLLCDQEKIDEILKDELIYDKGVYKNMLLFPQDNADAALQTILNASSDAMTEIANVLSQAFSESGGASMNAIEQKINEEFEKVAGTRWDFENEVPQENRNNPGEPWKIAKERGAILDAYYELKDKEDVLENISEYQKTADKAEEDFAKVDSKMRKAEEDYEQFNAFHTRLALQAKTKKTIEQISGQIEKLEGISKEWPKLNENLSKAKDLQKELDNRNLQEQYNKVKEIKDEIDSLNNELTSQTCPENEEITQVKAAADQIKELEYSLRSMNITAAVNMIGANQLEITSLLTGKPVELSDGLASITEAVKISVPGVMEMKLTPADVDATAIKAEIEKYSSATKAIFDKYKVDSIEGLSELAEGIRAKKDELSRANERLDIILGENKYDDLEAKANEIHGELREAEEINNDIVKLCGDDNVSKFITTNEAIIGEYEREHTSIDTLNSEIANQKGNLQEEKDSLPNVDDIPEEYLTIANPESHLEDLKSDLKNMREEREKSLNEKTTAVRDLEKYLENLSDDPEADRDEAERKFNETKELLTHWKHIKEVFQEKKDEIHDNPMQDIADSFTSYLSVISDGRVSSEFPDADKLNMNIYSDNSLIDYGKLSEGTKETVSLAFRLAVLDHLFPEGGGVIVFDDPFTDMDADRTAQSCQLIKECARKHQVIFLTCKDEYFDALGGNQINLS